MIKNLRCRLLSMQVILAIGSSRRFCQTRRAQSRMLFAERVRIRRTFKAGRSVLENCFVEQPNGKTAGRSFDGDDGHRASISTLDCVCRNLRKIMIKDLNLETNHRGSYVLLRFICTAMRMTVVMNIVEDEAGSVVPFAIYMQEPACGEYPQQGKCDHRQGALFQAWYQWTVCHSGRSAYRHRLAVRQRSENACEVEGFRSWHDECCGTLEEEGK